MPKRPCSLALTPNNRTILSADKFGDVYSLPLLPSATTAATTQSSAATPCGSEPPLGEPKSRSATPSTPTPTASTSALFKPQADELTVHTKRNLKALENQKISLGRRALQEQLNRPQFELTLLLGHVSMLTAICVGTVTSTSTEGKGREREYIITADRDEHIRVSRGMPQAHVIEGFCLGHEDFVSRLCVAPGGKDEILISGGGDDYLFVWDWVKGQLLGKAGVLEHVKGVVGQEATSKVAVTRVFACAWAGAGTGVFVVVER
jgi:tRNA (guanine-N(7)-)-methyltransferase subunit TRM82